MPHCDSPATVIFEPSSAAAAQIRGRISRAKRCWAPPGIRPHAPAQVVREYMYAYAAVAPTQGQMFSLVLPEASTAMMNLFLEQGGQTFSKYFIIMQVGLCRLA